MFKSVSDLVRLVNEQKKSAAKLMIEQEALVSDTSEAEVVAQMRESFNVMKRAVQKGINGVVSHSGMCGGDAKKLWEYIQNNKFITDITLLKAACYAIATNEVNASMGIICATPTAGSSGILPGALIAIQEKCGFNDDKIIDALFVAGAFGFIIANNAFISGAAGGCQAEIGSASSMAAAAVTFLMGGSIEQSAHAMAMAMKNMLGLTCDPLAGLVEVPCIKRNASGAVNAILTSELALAGIESKVPWDEVIAAMYATGKYMPSIFKETALGGLATTPTGIKWKEILWS